LGVSFGVLAGVASSAREEPGTKPEIPVSETPLMRMRTCSSSAFIDEECIGRAGRGM
jgi:hypothetical protein